MTEGRGWRGVGLMLLAASLGSCAQLFGFDKEYREVYGAGAAGGGGSAGTGGNAGSGGGSSGGGGSGGSVPVDCQQPGAHLEILAQGQVSPRAITVDSLRVYWTTEGPTLGDNGVWKRDKANGPPARVADTAARKPIGLLVDNTHAYWSDSSTLACPNRDGILRISHADPPDPGNFQILDSTCGRASMIALDTTRVYYARVANGYIHSALKLGGGLDDLLTAAGTAAPFGIAVDELHAYWTDQTSQQVVRALKDGSVQEDLSPASPSPRWIGLDNESVYWATDSLVLKHDKVTLGAASTELHAGLADIVALAVDPPGDALYVIDGQAGDVLKVSKDVGPPATTIIDSMDALGGVAVDEKFVYWTNMTTGQVLRACK